MATNLKKTNLTPYTISTSRLITIPTSPATQITMINSASIGMYVANVGPSTLAWSDTNVLMSTGGLLYYSMGKEWLPLRSGFSLYFIADSVAGALLVNEYKA